MDKQRHGLFRRNLDCLVMTGIVVLLITGTIIRNSVWNSDAMLWYDSTLKSPNKIRPYANLVGALITEGQYEKAKNWGLRALKCEGEKPYYLYYNIGNAYHHLMDVTTAYKYARKAVDLHRDQATMYQLGLILRDMGWREGIPSPATLKMPWTGLRRDSKRISSISSSWVKARKGSHPLTPRMTGASSPADIAL